VALDEALRCRAVLRAGEKEDGTLEHCVLSGAALIPLDDREEILPRALERPALRHHRGAGAAVDEEEDWIRRIVAADVDPLLDPADVDRLELVDTARSDGLDGGDDGASAVACRGGARLRDRAGGDGYDGDGGGGDECIKGFHESRTRSWIREMMVCTRATREYARIRGVIRPVVPHPSSPGRHRRRSARRSSGAQRGPPPCTAALHTHGRPAG